MKPSLVRIALACLFAALVSVGAYIAVPLPGSPVPIVLQNFFIMLSAFLLGPVWGSVATLVYLALGAIGLPVFSGGTGGLARFAGPTGGYLVSYLVATPLMGLLTRGDKPKFWRYLVAGLAGALVVYAVGVPWLKTALKAHWAKAFALGLVPFVPGDLIKIVLASLVALKVKPRLVAVFRRDAVHA